MQQQSYEHSLNRYATGRINFAAATQQKPNATDMLIAAAVRSGENSAVMPNAAQINSCPSSS
jgi:hypothetical protein